MNNSVWNCPGCGREGNTGNFCGTCGFPRPEGIVNSSSTKLDPTRFIEYPGVDNSKTIIDTTNNYTIKYTDNIGYIATDAEGKDVYHILPSGETIIYIDNGRNITINEPLSISDMNTDMEVTDNYGQLCKISNGNLVERTEYNEDGSIEKVDYYDLDGNMRREYANGRIEYVNSETKSLYKIIDEDGTIYLNGQPNTNDINCILNIDGTYSVHNSDNDTDEIVGSYYIDENGKIVLKNNNGDITVCNSDGLIISKTFTNGTIYNYDTESGTQIEYRNSGITYSKINHIEYDEDEYRNVLNILNSIEGSHIDSSCSSVETNVGSFPDRYSGSISGIKSSIDGHINLISSLSSMTNYSLLAYQTCDENLKDGLYMLVDSIFGDNESTLANNFKNTINNIIEDRNNDNILEYAKNTNFKYLSKSAIAQSVYTDDDGNKWYLSSNGTLVGTEGTNLKINYGGLTFSVNYDENGVLILKDSDGNSINIFGNYNIYSNQFGGNQGDMSRSYNNSSVDDILNKYFPNATTEEKVALLTLAGSKGCGYTAVTDYVFKSFEGNEEGFYDTFGYSMYEIKKTDNGFTVDYNYEPLIANLFCEVNSQSGERDIETTLALGGGTGTKEMTYMVNYLNENYGVKLNNVSDDIQYIADYGYNLYNIDGSLCYADGGAHAMVAVGTTEDGKTIVSTWGNKYIYEPSNNNRYKYQYDSTWKEGIKYGEDK